MRAGELGWAICLAGLPWSYFLIRHLSSFQHLDIWHANSWWMQASGFLLLGVYGSARIRLGTLPASCWWLVSWASLVILWRFTSLMRPGEVYLAAMLTGVANLWLVLLLALLLTGLTQEGLRRISQAIFWSGVGLTCYGLLQAMNLDQFFKWVDLSKPTDTVVGVVGNPTHFGCQLALWMPFALMQPKWRCCWAIPGGVVILLSQSSTAMGLFGLFLVGMAWRQSWRAGVVTLLLGVSVGIGLLHFYPAWLNLAGRMEVWQSWWQVVKEQPIIGGGVGFLKNVTDQLPAIHPLRPWKHLHNEYLQWWVETGVVGMGLLGWMLWQLGQRVRGGVQAPFRWACGWSLLAVGLISLTSFPWHLWQLGGWGLFSLCGWLVSTEPV